MENPVAVDLVEFLNASPTAFHAVDEVKKRLKSEGYEQVSEKEDWKLVAGKKYFFTRNHSTIVAFAIGEKYVPGNGIYIVGAHTDSPCLKLKPVSKVTKGGYLEVGVQCYGGGLWHTWFDRDLAIAGRIIVKEQKNGSEAYSHRLVRIEEPIMRIPTLAIHLDREVNDGFKVNKQIHLAPVLATSVKVIWISIGWYNRHVWIRAGLQTPLPPCEPRKAGRPQSLRRRDSDEPQMKTKRKCRGGGPPSISVHNKRKLKKVQETCTCSYCGERYHNINGCEKRKADDKLKGIEQPVRKKSKKDDDATKKPNTPQPDRNVNKVNLSVVGLMKMITKKPNNNVEGSRGQPPPPSMWDQMKATTTATQGFTKNLRIEGSIVHMNRAPQKTITRNNLEELRAKMKKTNKKL